MLKVELHTHTADDPEDVIPYTATELIDRAAELGYQALAITLHQKQLDVRRLRPYAAERGIVLIPGIEASIGGRHMLLLNFDSGAEDVRTFADLSRLRRRARGLVVAPHAFFPGSTCMGAWLDRHPALVDAVEINAMFTASLNFNRWAEAWAAAHGKPLVGNGDVHRLAQLGSTYSLIDADPDPDSICEAVAAGRVAVEAKPLTWPVALRIMADLVGTKKARWRGARRLSRNARSFEARLRFDSFGQE
jgi:predicted metal-dependent phosphoesterase TrpH